MNCSLCDQELRDGEKVVVELPGEIAAGKFVQTDEDEIHHEVCGDDA